MPRPNVSPTSIETRPSQRLLPILLIGLTLATAAYGIWSSCFRYRGYGVISGRVLDVAAEFPGTIKCTHVRDGDLVRPGDPLFSLTDENSKQQIAEMEAELQLEMDTVSAEVYEAQWLAQWRTSQSQRSLSEYHSLAAALAAKRTELEVVTARLRRLESLQQRNAQAVKGLEVEQLQATETGFRQEIVALEQAALSMKQHATIDIDHAQGVADKTHAKHARLRMLQDKLAALRERSQQSIVRASANGRIARKCCFAGEFVNAGQPVMQVLEDGTIEVKLFLQQRAVADLKVGQHLPLKLDGHPKPLRCKVVNIATELTEPPTSLARYFRSGEGLIAVVAELPLEVRLRDDLPLGSTVRVIREWKAAPTSSLLSLNLVK